jgi:hypothetical protein
VSNEDCNKTEAYASLATDPGGVGPSSKSGHDESCSTQKGTSQNILAGVNHASATACGAAAASGGTSSGNAEILGMTECKLH